MPDVCHLGSSDTVHYIGRAGIKHEFEDVKLISSDKKCLSINSCVFAALSPICQEMVNEVYLDPYSGQEYYISTGFSTNKLQTLVLFAKTGTIIHSANTTAKLFNDQNTCQVFQAFGIELSSLSFTINKLHSNEEVSAVTVNELHSQRSIKEESIVLKPDENYLEVQSGRLVCY